MVRRQRNLPQGGALLDESKAGYRNFDFLAQNRFKDWKNIVRVLTLRHLKFSLIRSATVTLTLQPTSVVPAVLLRKFSRLALCLLFISGLVGCTQPAAPTPSEPVLPVKVVW